MRSINKYVLPSAVSLVTAMGVAVPAAQAFDFKASGQVDRAVTAVDNGHRSDIGFVDNAGSNTRFRFTGDQVMDNGMKVGFDYEIAIGNNASADWDVKNAGNEQNNFLDNRQANIYLEGNFGRFTLGKVDGAANATSEVDYSGLTYLGGGVDFADYAGGLSFWGKNGQVAAGNPKVGQVFNSFDALSRQNAIRYDSPTFSGVTLSASLDSGHAYELAARYATALARGGKFGVAADYVDSQNQGEKFDPTKKPLYQRQSLPGIRRLGVVASALGHRVHRFRQASPVRQLRAEQCQQLLRRHRLRQRRQPFPGQL